MPIPAGGGAQGPSCSRRMMMGFAMGACVGAASGLIFGGITAFRYGVRGRELFNQLGQVMAQGGGTFGTFMAIGTAVRC